MRKSKKRALYRSTTVTLLILIITFYLIEYGFLPLQVYYGGATGRIIVGIASFLAARCFMGGFIRKRDFLSFLIFICIYMCFLVFGSIYLIFGLNEDAQYFVYPCLLPALLGVLTKLHWRHVLVGLKYLMESELKSDKESKQTNDDSIEDDFGAVEFVEVTPESKLDPLLEEVAKYVVEHKDCSVPTIQSNFEVEFNRAGRIAVQLERAGVLSSELPAQRQILVDDYDNAMQKIETLRKDVEEQNDEDKENI